MAIHGIFSAYFGDGEYDAGKSVRWNMNFFDTEYIQDLGDGHNTRQLLIGWKDSFAQVEFGYYGKPMDFFTGGHGNWRKESFESADKIWGYGADDWVTFVDCTEGMSFDPTDDLVLDPYLSVDSAGRGANTNTNVFKPYIEQEIAVAGGNGTLYVPVYAFSRHSSTYSTTHVIDPDLQIIIDDMEHGDTYLGLDKHELLEANTSEVVNAYDFYVFGGWLPRIFKVSTLRDPAFNWNSLDTFVTVGPPNRATEGLSIISYAYARWSHDPTRTDPILNRPLTEADDEGFRMRKKISQVRPIVGLPYSLWSDADTGERQYPITDPELVLPPDTEPVDRQFSPAFNGSFASFESALPVDGAAWGSWNLLTPLYTTLFRGNLRDGLYFLKDEFGPTPWNFLTNQPALSPEDQAEREGQSFEEYEPPVFAVGE